MTHIHDYFFLLLQKPLLKCSTGHCRRKSLKSLIFYDICDIGEGIRILAPFVFLLIYQNSPHIVNKNTGLNATFRVILKHSQREQNYLNEKYWGLISCSTIKRSWTLGSTLFILETNFAIIALMPFSDSSSVLMKKSRISDIKLVKQKKQSASACSETADDKNY